MAIQPESRVALRELIELLQEVDEHWCSEERNLASAEDAADGLHNDTDAPVASDRGQERHIGVQTHATLSHAAGWDRTF